MYKSPAVCRTRVLYMSYIADLHMVSGRTERGEIFFQRHFVWWARGSWQGCLGENNLLDEAKAVARWPSFHSTTAATPGMDRFLNQNEKGPLRLTGPPLKAKRQWCKAVRGGLAEKLEALGHKVNTAHILVVGVGGDGVHGRLHVGVGHGHPLDGVLGAALVHLDQLAVPREVVGDLPHTGHACVDELDGEIAVLVGHHAHAGRNFQTRVLKNGRV